MGNGQSITQNKNAHLVYKFCHDSNHDGVECYLKPTTVILYLTITPLRYENDFIWLHPPNRRYLFSLSFPCITSNMSISR